VDFRVLGELIGALVTDIDLLRSGRLENVAVGADAVRAVVRTPLLVMVMIPLIACNPLGL